MDSLYWAPKPSLCIIEVCRSSWCTSFFLGTPGLQYSRSLFYAHHLHLGTSVPDATSLWMTLAFATCFETSQLFFHQEQNCITVLSSRYLCPTAIQPFTDAVSLIGYREFISSCPAEFALFLCWLFIRFLYCIHRGDLLIKKLQRLQTFNGKPSLTGTLPNSNTLPCLSEVNAKWTCLAIIEQP